MIDKERITELMIELEKLTQEFVFVLNPRIVALQKEIKELQAQCEHDYDENGVCKICCKMEEEE